MPRFPSELQDLLVACRTPSLTNKERGDHLEDLVAIVFSAVPGVEVKARNQKSVFENEELDLLMTNRRVEDGLPSVGTYFSVECKNWSRPVGSSELSWFATKLRRSGQGFGVLVTMHGITGTEIGRTAAHFEVATALTEGQQVVVLTLEELSWLRSGEQLAQLLVEKIACLVARREIFVAPEEPDNMGFSSWRYRINSQQERDEALAIASKTAIVGPGQGRNAAGVVGEFRNALKRFITSENHEPFGEKDKPFPEIQHEQWTKANYEAFMTVILTLEAISSACILRLRIAEPDHWPLERLNLYLDTRIPRNLNAAPDSRLALLLLDYWTEEIEEGFDYWTPALSLLGWSLEWTAAMKAERWPPPLV